MTTCNCTLPGPCAACSPAARTYTPTGWTTDYQRNTLPPFDPKCGPHDYRPAPMGDNAALAIVYCSRCGDVRKLEVPA